MERERERGIERERKSEKERKREKATVKAIDGERRRERA